MSAIPSGMDLQRSLDALTDALDASLGDEILISELYALAGLVGRNKPEVHQNFGALLSRGGYTREEVDSLVALFVRCQFQKQALVQALEAKAAAVADRSGICPCCVGRGCDDCMDVATEARDYELAERWDERGAR